LTPSVLAKHYASGFLPEVCTSDEPIQAPRQQVTRRKQIVRQRSRLKNIIRSILHSDLMSRNAPIRYVPFLRPVSSPASSR
jgi:transposase